MKYDRVKEFTDFLKDCGNGIITNIADYQSRFMEYLEKQDFSKILALVKELDAKYKPAMGSDLIEYYDLISSTPLAKEEVKEQVVSARLQDTLIYKFEEGQPEKQIINLKHTRLSYEECKSLSDTIIGNVYANERKLVFPFIVSNNFSAYGRITHKLSNKSPYNLLSIILRDTKQGIKQKVSFLGDDKTLFTADKYIQDLYTYYFTTIDQSNPDNIKEYTLLCVNPLPMEDMRINGMILTIADSIKVGTNAKIVKGTNIIFVTDYSAIVNNISTSEFLAITNRYKDNYDALYRDYFGEFRHPRIFEKMILAWLFSSDQAYGPMNNYKPNFGFIGPSRGGKSMILDCVSKVFNERKNGENVTIKGYVPSFGGTRPSAGEFLKSKRFCLAEEFVNTIMRNQDPLAADYMKSMLVHDKVFAVSGRHDGEGIYTNPTACFTFVSNFQMPKMSNFVDFANMVSPAFLARFIIYVQTEEHLQFVKDRQRQLASLKKVGMDEKNMYMPKYNPYKVELYDYLFKQRVEFGDKNEFEIIDELRKILPDNANIREMYNGYNEHLVRIIDGITKVNYMIEGRNGLFVVTDKDFAEAKEIFSFIINSWTGNIQNMSDKHKIMHLNKTQRAVFELVKDNEGIVKDEIYRLMKDNVRKELDYLMKINLISLKNIGSTDSYVLRTHNLFDVKVEEYD